MYLFNFYFVFSFSRIPVNMHLFKVNIETLEKGKKYVQV